MGHIHAVPCKYTAMGKFWKKLRAQKELKSLLSDAFSGLQICQNCFRWGSLQPSPSPLAVLRGGLPLRGGSGEGRGGGEEGRAGGRGEKRREGEARGGEGRGGESCAPFLKFLDPPLHDA